MRAIDRLMDALVAYQGKHVFNPWAQVCPLMDEDRDAPTARQARLRAHLSASNARWLLLGEGAGYQGCRYSGVTFTSERLLLEGVIPRIARLDRRITRRPKPFSEPSATIVWGALQGAGIQEQVVMWNAFPWHPMRPGDNPLTNRTPTETELAAGRPLLDQFLALFPSAQVVAVGRKAAGTLRRLGIEPAAELRHPAMGGANEFRAGLARLAGAQ